ncbi:MAG: UPF0182 family protein [Microbacteriaceae bacterium]
MSTATDSSRRMKIIALSIGAVVLLAFACVSFAALYADVLWFDQLGYLSVWWTQVSGRVLWFFIGFLGMAVPVWLSLWLAYRNRPVYARVNSQLDQYQEALEPLRRALIWGIPAVLGLFAGMAAAASWETIALFFAQTSFGVADPQFGLDQGFYVFALPFYRSVVAFISATLFLSTLLVIALSYVYGGIRIVGREVVLQPAARIQIAVTVGLYIVLQGVSFWLDQYLTVTETNTMFTGANYTAVNASIPGLQIVSAISVVVGILFLVTAILGRWKLPLVSTALLIVTALLLGSMYPLVVQRFVVDPNAKALESEFIQRNIDATRVAYGVDAVDVTSYDAQTTAEPGALKNDAETTASIRLMDPDVISPTVAQLQQFKQYYSFASKLDVDRYEIDGANQDTVVAVRELNFAGLNDGQTWVNEHLVYTHGYGMVLAAGNQRTVDGYPVFLDGNIPTSGVLSPYQARVYFGEGKSTYSIVGADQGSAPIELDYASAATDSTAAQSKVTFDGNGGPKLDSLLNRLVYAVKFQSEQILLSDSVNSSSQILYTRDPSARVHAVAPYLTLDSDPYPTVVDGRLVWLVDGYTQSDNYAYSTKVDWQDATSDATTNAGLGTQVNYVRNAVKATVDAYDGSVKLYAWDADEPILKAWQSVYPSTLRPISEMSGDLMSHVRYPSDLFKAQRQILGQYHVTDAGTFFSKDEAWTTPVDPTSTDGATLQPPYYLTLQMPGQSTPSYSLYTTFIPDAAGDNSRSVLKGYLAVDSNAGSQAGTVAESYGKLRMLALPEGDTVPGPGQVQGKFNADASVSSYLNVVNQRQSKVIYGNLLTLPVGGGLLYVQPVFVQSTGETSYPLLQKVLVAFGNQIAFEDTLNEALNSLFGGNSGAQTGDANAPTESTTSNPPTSGGSTNTDQLASLLAQAKSLIEQKQAALAAGDLAKYAQLDQQLTGIINQLVALQGG